MVIVHLLSFYKILITCPSIKSDIVAKIPAFLVLFKIRIRGIYGLNGFLYILFQFFLLPAIQTNLNQGNQFVSNWKSRFQYFENFFQQKWKKKRFFSLWNFFWRMCVSDVCTKFAYRYTKRFIEAKWHCCCGSWYYDCYYLLYIWQHRVLFSFNILFYEFFFRSFLRHFYCFVSPSI